MSNASIRNDIPGSLPNPLTSFIGRQHELAEARRLLAGCRLLTLTGPGGSGKTRLAIQLAALVGAEYPDGTWFVRLAPVNDPALVPSSIAQGIGLPDSKERPLVEHLAAHLRDRKLLLVLDNFEHVLAAAPVALDLLAGASQLRIVATSRSPLRISGEQECPVPPLTVPVTNSGSDLASCDSVRLFAARAAAAMPGFTVDDQNAETVAEIVRKLDGLPLAIELAAARLRLLSPTAVLERLADSLALLTGGSRDLPGRQQTLRATIEWSHNLLSLPAQRLLAVCSVFRGGASLAAVETVSSAGASEMSVLDGLQELVEQNMLRHLQVSAESRYAMLETIREYAAARLAEAPEARQVHAAHAAFFLAIAEDAQRTLTRHGQRECLERLELEHNNLRTALDWYGREDPAAALRLAAGLSMFWSLHGHYTEARQRLRQLLTVVPDESAVRARALNGAGWLAIDQGDYADADSLLAEGTAVSRHLGDPVSEGMAAAFMARSMLSSSRVAQGAPHADRAYELLLKAGDQPGVAFAVFYRALAAQFTGDLRTACELLELAADRSQELGFESLHARSMQLLGVARLNLGQLKAARAALEAGLPVSVELGDRFVIPVGLSGFAGLAAKAGKHRLALRIAGAADGYREAYESALPEPNRAYIEDWLAPSHKAIGEAAAARLMAEGRRMTLRAAVECALNAGLSQPTRLGGQPALTAREEQVAALVALGLTNRAIAGRLSLSVRTVEVHVDHILTKLAFSSRTQLAGWMIQQGLQREDTYPGT